MDRNQLLDLVIADIESGIPMTQQVFARDENGLALDFGDLVRTDRAKCWCVMGLLAKHGGFNPPVVTGDEFDHLIDLNDSGPEPDRKAICKYLRSLKS